MKDEELLNAFGMSRREVFRVGGVAGLVAASMAAGSRPAAAQPVKSNARIVIVGAGAAGLSAANRLAAALDGAKITLIDKRAAHLYQPGFTLIAGGLKSADYVVSKTTDYVPRSAELITEAAAEIDPEGKKVVTETGRAVPYDYLVVTCGLHLDYAGIQGMDVSLIGKDGLGSVYASPEGAAATWRAAQGFIEKGGEGVFLRPNTEMKCAGAPLKYAFIIDDRLRRAGNRGKAKINYLANNKTLFGVPIVAEKVRMLFAERNVQVAYDNVLAAIDPGKRIATFKAPEGMIERQYDFINVIPPMRAPDVVRKSPLPWKTGPFAAEGYVEVDRKTLRHSRYPEVFAIGDVAGVPKGKTAASVKWQAPVAIDHLVADIAGKESKSTYDGYTSCPLITQLGRAMLIEFDYNNNLVPSFPGVIAPLEELWTSWVMKTIALKPTYMAMLRGNA